MLKKSYQVRISWKRNHATADRQTNSYVLDMAQFEGFRRIGASDPLIQMAEELKHIREDWQWVARGSHKLGVDVYDTSDRIHERRLLERRWRRERLRAESSNDGEPGSEPKQNDI